MQIPYLQLRQLCKLKVIGSANCGSQEGQISSMDPQFMDLQFADWAHNMQTAIGNFQVLTYSVFSSKCSGHWLYSPIYDDTIMSDSHADLIIAKTILCSDSYKVQDAAYNLWMYSAKKVLKNALVTVHDCACFMHWQQQWNCIASCNNLATNLPYINWCDHGAEYSHIQYIYAHINALWASIQESVVFFLFFFSVSHSVYIHTYNFVAAAIQ